MFGATAPIAAALRALEAVVDVSIPLLRMLPFHITEIISSCQTFAFDLIALIPTQSGPATAQVVRTFSLLASDLRAS